MDHLSRRGICYNLQYSPYRVNIDYTGDPLEYVFSSELYLHKFLTRLKENRNNINSSLSIKFDFNIKADKLADLKLYLSIEKRGFLINENGRSHRCLDHIILDGEIVTPKN